jgi:hypothetical protein
LGRASGCDESREEQVWTTGGEPAEKGAKDVVAEGIAKAHRIPGEEKVPRDLVEARKTITKMVRESATEIVSKLIEVAKTGQVAQAKYLFEAVGLYPPTEETTTANAEDSLAYILLKRLGLPTEPVISEEEELFPSAGAGYMKTEANPSSGLEGDAAEVEGLLQEPTRAPGDAVK